MILVKVQKQKTEITEITIKGHADSAPYGQDLVCAAVSAIVIGTLNAIEEMAEGSCEIEQNEARTVIAVKEINPTLSIILEVMLYQMRSIAESYRQYLDIEEETSYEI